MASPTSPAGTSPSEDGRSTETRSAHGARISCGNARLGVGDDAADGYIRSSLWINTAASKLWWCADATTGGAVWVPLNISPFMQTVLDDADAPTARTTLAAAPDTLPGFRNRLIIAISTSGSAAPRCRREAASAILPTGGISAVLARPTPAGVHPRSDSGAERAALLAPDCRHFGRQRRKLLPSATADRERAALGWQDGDALVLGQGRRYQAYGHRDPAELRPAAVPSADVIVYAGQVSLTTSWEQFTITNAMPSLSGKTIGTNGDDSMQVNFWYDAGANFNSNTNTLGQQSGTFDIAQVQFEEGSVVTPFERGRSVSR